MNEILTSVYCNKMYLEEEENKSKLNTKEMKMIIGLIGNNIESTSTSLFELATEGNTPII